eukprot:1203-Prorocentrum_minimum.AAC.2
MSVSSPSLFAAHLAQYISQSRRGCAQHPGDPSRNGKVFESEAFGNVLVLDGVIQCTQKDEFSYQVRDFTVQLGSINPGKSLATRRSLLGPGTFLLEGIEGV